MTKTMRTKEGISADVWENVRTYPGNRLGKQVCELSETFSGFAMLRERFASK